MVDLKDRLQKRELTIGSWITFSDPAVAEIMARAGFDWLTVDMEHSGLSMSQAQEMIRTIELCGVPPLVRVMENNPELIKKFMDMGAHGVIVPLVNSRSDAQKAVNAVKYPPRGTRGVGLARAQRYSMDLDSYMKWNQEKSIVIVQIEHINAVANLEAIMDVEGVDGMMIGLYDLSGSLGHPGQFDHPEVCEAIDEIYKKSRVRGYLIGQHVVNPYPQGVLDAIDRGVRFIGFSDDFLYLGEYCRNQLGEIRKKLK
jgi:2-dehydro-3-deoxyglucarate aldolase